MLRLNNISKAFNKGNVNEYNLFNKLSLEIEDGDFICVLGSNGAGKSSLLNIISGKMGVDGGEILLNDRDIKDEDEYSKCKIISRIFQDPSLGTNPGMTVFENLSMAENKGKKYNLGFLLKDSNRDYFKEELLKLNMGLEDKLDTKVSELSGGQRQGVAMIMAVMGEPDLLLLDEHTAALDPKSSERVMEITDEIVRDRKLTTMMVTHNIDHALSYGNRLIMVHRGRVIFDLDRDEKAKLSQDKLLSMFQDLSDRILFN